MNRLYRHLNIFICLILLSITVYSQQPYEPVHNYDVEHIKIEVKFNLQKKTLEGKITTSIRSTVDKLDSFRVDAAWMKIKSVKEWVHYHTNNPDLAVQFEDTKYRYNNKQITVVPSHPIAKNFPYEYRVEYSVRDPERGMYFIQPDSLFPDKPYQVWTQGEDEDNHWWFPCYDFPNDKATTETYITIDKKYITLSNGELVDTKSNPDGTKTWHWVLNHPHSSYFVMLAAGKFDIISDAYDSIPIYSYVPVGKREEGERSFSRTADMVKFYSEKIGYKYPWQRYSQIVVQDFIYGGMENTSVTVLTDASLYDKDTPPDYTAVGLIAHELAHDWWGDNVTCKNWDEIWLNEGFATYFEALYREHAFGKDEFDYEIFRNGQGAIEADSADRRPIYIDTGLYVYAYDKAAVVLNMLRYIMGDDDFWNGMNIYITQNQFGNVVTGDLIHAVNEVYNDPLRDRIPRDFSWFFDEWIYKAGQPAYKVSYDYNKQTDKVKLTLQQVQKPDSLMSIFKMPVPVEVVTEKSKLEYSLVCDTALKTYTLSLDAPLKTVIFNKGNKVLCKLYFSKPKEDWFNQLSSEDAIDRITAIRGLKDFIHDDDVITALGSILTSDKFRGTRQEAASMLADAGTSGAVEILESAYKHESNPRVRRSILLALGKMKKNFPECADTKELTDFIINNINSEKSKYAVADGINALVDFTDKEKLYDMVLPYANTDSHNEVIKRAVARALRESPDPKAIEILINYAIKGKVRRLRAAAIRGLGSFAGDKRVKDALYFLIFDRDRRVKRVTLSVIKRTKDKSFLPYLEKLLKQTNDEGMHTLIEKVIEGVK
jgi:aminopeptidase N